VEALVAHLERVVDPAPRENGDGRAPRAESEPVIPDEIQKLSDREAEALLLRRLAALGAGDGGA
jgi:hypothetical protein